MNRQEKFLPLALACGAAVSALVCIGCSMPLGVMQHTDIGQSIGFITFVLSSMLSAAYVWLQFYKKRVARKSQLAYTGIIACVAVLAALAMPQIATAYDVAAFSVAVVSVWIPLSATNRLQRAFIKWSPFAAFLTIATVFVDHDYLGVISLLQILFSAGPALYRTSVRKIAEWGSFAVVGSIFVLIGITGIVAVMEMGMPPEGYEVLILYEGIYRTSSYFDGIATLATSFF